MVWLWVWCGCVFFGCVWCGCVLFGCVWCGWVMCVLNSIIVYIIATSCNSRLHYSPSHTLTHPHTTLHNIIHHHTTLHNITQQGTLFVNQYVVIQNLGSGTFGKVKLALNLFDEELYAIKLVNKGRAKRRNLGHVRQYVGYCGWGYCGWGYCV